MSAKWLRRSTIGLALLAVGCESNDAERLSRIGRRFAENAQALFVKAESQLGPGWRAGFDDLGLGARVSARLRWDKLLADAPLVARVVNGRVELRGQVADMASRRRAVDLAESTQGVESVVDAMELP